MCGRYTITASLDVILSQFHISQVTLTYAPRYNVAPGQLIPAIISGPNHERRLGELKWGLIPNWSKDEKIAYKTINAKAETLMEKPAFKLPLLTKRCIIPADGFYEWKTTTDGKQPMRIQLKSQKPFGFAGLYDTWIAPDGRKISSCTIITTSPNSLVAEIHNRMPVILRPEDEQVWLNRIIQDTSTLVKLLRPFPADEMLAYPVSSRIGNAKHDDPECIHVSYA